MSFAFGVALAFASALTGTSTLQMSVPTPSAIVMPKATTVQEYVRAYFADIPVMSKVAFCESTFRQFDKDGSVHRGVVNSKDVGVMQINEYYHLETAEKLGLDIYTIQGNVAYARYLFEKEGTTPWLSSSPCWGKENHIARK